MHRLSPLDLILSAAIILAVTVSGAASTISEAELKDALPPYGEADRPKQWYRYLIPQAEIAPLNSHVKELAAKGDIFKAINSRLASLQPGTAESEREIFIWVWVLKDFKDARGLDGLDRAASLTPKVASRNEDGGRISFYPFDELARGAADNIRVEMQATEWATHLKDLPKEDRIRQLADIVWLDAPTPENLTGRGAGRLLLRECPKDECWLKIILERIDKIDESSPVGKKRIVSALMELRAVYQRGKKAPEIIEKVRAIRGRHPKDRIGDAAENVLREINSRPEK
ncbi:MAG: hypothetical protein HY077_07225 [Elusimicrobia bacterium]|nr:hypothetical protein [Elusimicrobiota bacterium]